MRPVVYHGPRPDGGRAPARPPSCNHRPAQRGAGPAIMRGRRSDPDDLKVRYRVIVGVLRHDRNAVSDRGSSDPAIVDRRLAPHRAEPGDQECPNFGHRLVHGEGFEPLRKLVSRQSAGGGLGILSLQHAEPQLPQRYRRDTPLEIPETTDIEPCSLKADKDGRICQRPLGDHQGRSSVVSVRVARNSSDRPVVSGPSRTSSWPISDAGSHCRRRESGMIFATGWLSLKTSISSPASTRRKTSAVWLRSSRAGMAAICQV